MTPRAPSPPPAIDTEELGLDRGAHLLVGRALRALEPGDRLVVRGRHPDLGVHLRAWCRDAGHRVTAVEPTGGEHGGIVVEIVAGDAERRRWTGAVRAGNADWQRPGAVAERPQGRWGLAARGALVEAGAPEL
ncbi:MAG TPA: sulfurtransferase TusA family protein, partial [Candidatus Dormibacteraeota bacterium]